MFVLFSNGMRRSTINQMPDVSEVNYQRNSNAMQSASLFDQNKYRPGQITHTDEAEHGCDQNLEHTV